MSEDSEGVSAPEADGGTQPGMQALSRGLAVLDLIAGSAENSRFNRIQEASGIPKGTLHRILQTLVDERYLTLDPQGQNYRLGARPFQLAHRVWDEFDLRAAAEPEMIRLSRQTGEAVRLGVLHGSEILYVDQQDMPKAVRLANGVGANVSLHGTAMGKAILSHLDAPTRHALLSGQPLDGFTDQTVTDPADLDKQLNLVKARGYAVSTGEQHEDINAVAAPILDHKNRPIAGIAVLGPAYRLSVEQLHAFGREVIQAARRISRNAGETAMSISVAPRPLGAGGSDVACVIPGEDFLGEGPVWDARTQRLTWVDILAPGIITGDPATGERSFRALEEMIGVAIPREGGGWLCAAESGIRLLSTSGEMTTLATPEADRPGNRLNDGKCDALGRFWVGSLAISTLPDMGALWRCEADGRVTRMLDGIHVSNGLGWSPDNRTFYFIDSGRRVLWAHDFDLASGEIANRRVLRQFTPEDGTPDGLSVDAEGGIWVAMWDGWSLLRLTPEGQTERKILLPVPRPTSCTFGGPDLSTLYVTSARIRLSRRQLLEAPLSGGVFALSPGVTGLPTRLFPG